jgi:hypothetical protein
MCSSAVTQALVAAGLRVEVVDLSAAAPRIIDVGSWSDNTVAARLGSVVVDLSAAAFRKKARSCYLDNTVTAYLGLVVVSVVSTAAHVLSTTIDGEYHSLVTAQLYVAHKAGKINPYDIE